MNEKEFHKWIKEILASRRGINNSPDSAFYALLANEVQARSGEVWDAIVAAHVVRGFEWATVTQPKRDDLKEVQVKNILGKFLSERGYELVFIGESSKNTPDCYIDNGKQRYICEIKSPILMFDNKTQTYKFKTSHTKLLNFIHTAAKQFKVQDTNHELPWVLLFTSSHPQLNWKTFTDTIKGGVIGQDGMRLPDFSKTPAYISTQRLIYELGAYVWFQVNANDERIVQASYFF